MLSSMKELPTWFVIRKKPILREASRTSSAKACRSASDALYMRDTSINGMVSFVVATFDLAVTVEPLTSLITCGPSEDVCTAVVVAMVTNDSEPEALWQSERRLKAFCSKQIYYQSEQL